MFDLERNGDTCHISMPQQLVVGNRIELKKLVMDQLETRGCRSFEFHFDRTDYIDSSGLGSMATLEKRIREVGGRLKMCGFNEDLAELLEITKLCSLFLAYDRKGKLIGHPLGKQVATS